MTFEVATAAAEGDGVDWVALAGVVLAGVSLVWQGIGAFHRRRRLVVRATNGVVGEDRDGEIWQVPFVELTAHALGGPIGIQTINFEHNPPSKSGHGWSPLTLPGMPGQIDLGRDHPALQEGETAVWRFRVHGPSGRGVEVDTSVTAIFTLTSGKKVRTDPVQLHPDMSPAAVAELFRLADETIRRQQEGE